MAPVAGDSARRSSVGRVPGSCGTEPPEDSPDPAWERQVVPVRLLTGTVWGWSGTGPVRFAGEAVLTRGGVLRSSVLRGKASRAEVLLPELRPMRF